ncbi:MAG: hypothetical protein H9535_01035 [Ignavibacteria bacterium]|nr:hypothetical protein [Ignavibacteria bacterium]
MKRLVLCGIICAMSWLTAQYATAQESTNANVHIEATAPRTINNAYIELLGAGVLGSVNYEYIFSEMFGFRIGCLPMAGSFNLFVLDRSYNRLGMIMPIGLFALIGSGNDKLEISYSLPFIVNTNQYGVDMQIFPQLPSLGYRYQPAQGGFLFRATAMAFPPKSVIAPYSDFIIPFIGLSFGWSF